MDVLKNKTKDWKLDLRSFIARWVTPTAPCIDEIVAGVAQQRPKGIQGANCKNNIVIQEEMKCIYDYLGRELKYVSRSLAFAEGDYNVQNVSLPSTTMDLKSGNCLDLSILLASCFEALKLHTFIVMIPRHAFLKVKLFENEIIYIESTYIGRKEYWEAVESAEESYKKFFSASGAKDGACEISIDMARKSGILPME